MHRFTLEPYKSGGANRYTCPSCGKRRQFTRYIDVGKGQYLGDHVGRCNRESSCGYHYSPSDFFRDNPNYRVDDTIAKPFPTRRETNILNSRPIRFDTIPIEVLKKSLSNTRENAFNYFLTRTFGTQQAAEAQRRYLVGTWKDGRTVFWQVDRAGKIRTGKLMAYNRNTGKRLKNISPSWVHADRTSSGFNPEKPFMLLQCFFGEHLVGKTDSPVAVVESEKTAIIMSTLYPRHIWLATGGCKNLKVDRLKLFYGAKRQIALFPDSSQFKAWSAIADEARRRMGLNIKISDLLERRLSAEQIAEDIDLADVVISALKRRPKNEQNNAI
jgi:hypothetical protein